MTHPQCHGLLLPRFSLLSLGGAIDALAAANDLQAEVAYRVLTLSLDGRPVRASGGTPVAAAHGLSDAPALDAVFVVSDLPLPDAERDGHGRTLHPWLRERTAARVLLGGIGTGATVLAQAGLLAGYRATLPWNHVQHLAESHARVVVSSKLYEIDRGRLSCAGATASLDLLVAWLGQRHGERVAQELVAPFGLERLRGGDERQRAPLAALIGGGSSKVGEAVSLRVANLGEPLPTEDIARLVGVSRRQLERLFKQHRDELPSRYCAELRLKRERRLLQQTSQSIMQVGLACGFSSGSHFSNAYRARFAHTPREERSQRAAAWRDNVSSIPAPASAAGAAFPVGPAQWPQTTSSSVCRHRMTCPRSSASPPRAQSASRPCPPTGPS